MLVIQDYYLLNALLQVLWTIKFDVPPEESGEIASSRLVAEIYNLTYDAVIVSARKSLRENVARNLEVNRLAENREFEMKSVYSHIKQANAEWKNWTKEQKINFVEILLSPYKSTSDFLNSVVEKGDEINNTV